MKKIIKIITTIVVVVVFSSFLIYTYYADASSLNNINVTIENINIQQLGLSYCNLKIRINISNPNNREISNLVASFNIYITENYIGEGNLSKISIPSLSYKQKDVIITIYYSEVATAVVEGIKKGEFTLSAKGTISGNVLFDLMTISQQFEASKAYI